MTSRNSTRSWREGSAQAGRNSTTWEDIFPATDLSEHLRTQKLLEAWYLLASHNVAVLVDTVKPRAFKLFAFGKVGTLQQLLRLASSLY